MLASQGLFLLPWACCRTKWQTARSVGNGTNDCNECAVLPFPSILYLKLTLREAPVRDRRIPTALCDRFTSIFIYIYVKYTYIYM